MHVLEHLNSSIWKVWRIWQNNVISCFCQFVKSLQSLVSVFWLKVMVTLNFLSRTNLPKNKLVVCQMLLKDHLNQTICEIFSPIFLCHCVNFVMAFIQSLCEDVNEISLTEANWADWGFYVCVGVWIYNCACVCRSVRSANYSFPVTSADHTNAVSTSTSSNILSSLSFKLRV